MFSLRMVIALMQMLSLEFAIIIIYSFIIWLSSSWLACTCWCFGGFAGCFAGTIRRRKVACSGSAGRPSVIRHLFRRSRHFLAWFGLSYFAWGCAVLRSARVSSCRSAPCDYDLSPSVGNRDFPKCVTSSTSVTGVDCRGSSAPTEWI